MELSASWVSGGVTVTVTTTQETGQTDAAVRQARIDYPPD